MSKEQPKRGRADSLYWSPGVTFRQVKGQPPPQTPKGQSREVGCNKPHRGSYAQIANASGSVSSFSYHQSEAQEPLSYVPPTKMLLPPLYRPHLVLYAPKVVDKNRTLHACDKCRKARAKCFGGQPCEKCKNENKECIYSDGKRDKERREMERIQGRNDELVHVLQGLLQHSQIDAQWKGTIQKLLVNPQPPQLYADDNMNMVLDPNLDSLVLDSSTTEQESGLEELDSTKSLGAINEDTNRDEYVIAAGFMGKSSAVTWAMRAKRQAIEDFEEMRGFQKGTPGPAHSAFASSSYDAEDADFPIIETDSVNALDLPTPPIARALVESYFRHVHVSFPVMSKHEFMISFNHLLSQGQLEEISSDQQGWLCLLNLVFAIGAKHAHLTEAEHRGDDRDHIIYFMRAQNLGLGHRTLYKDAELQHTSCLGLLGLYFLVTDQTNRAWMISGMAIRHAMALDLHLRSTAKDLTDVEKHIRYRIWWSLYSLERLLDELTGRPSCAGDRDISAPFQFGQNHPMYSSRKSHEGSLGLSPLQVKAKGLDRPRPRPFISASTGNFSPFLSPSTTESPHQTFAFPSVLMPVPTSTFFIYRTQLSIISHKVLTELYSAALVGAKWSDVQDTIRQIDARLISWKESLPEEFNFSCIPSGDVLGLQRTGLAMFYNSSQMMLFRPCLCRFEGRLFKQSNRSDVFNATCVAKCVKAARDVINAFPSIKYPLSVYAITPWWSTTHFLIEAASVLMLELAYRAEHVPGLAVDILVDSKKAVMWLRAMATKSIAARKGWEVFDGLLRAVAPNVGGTAEDMPNSAPVPPGWRGVPFGYQSQDSQNQARVNQQTATSAWVDQSRDDHSQYAMQQNFPGTAYDTNSATPTYVSTLQPFNPSGQIYGRYDEFGPWHNSSYHEETYGGSTPMSYSQLLPMTCNATVTISPVGSFSSYMDDGNTGSDVHGRFGND